MSWGRSAGDTCWNCGVERPRPSCGNWVGTVTFDESHEWSRASLQPLIAAVDGFSQQMAQLTASVDEFQQRYIAGVDFAPVEQRAVTWLDGNTAWRILPSVADVNAQTVAEIEQGEPLAAWERELLESIRPGIRIPAGAEITPVAPVPLPETIDTALLEGRRRPESQRYYFNRPVTETRRTS